MARGVTDYLLTVPPQDLATTEGYLAVLGGHPVKFPPGERFSYSNSGYVVLALIAERISGVAFGQLVAERVCGPARMADTETESTLTEGAATVTLAECNSSPPLSWTTSALPQSTRHTARRRPTVVSGSYVTLSSSTRRTGTSAGTVVRRRSHH